MPPLTIKIQALKVSEMYVRLYLVLYMYTTLSIHVFYFGNEGNELVATASEIKHTLSSYSLGFSVLKPTTTSLKETHPGVPLGEVRLDYSTLEF